MEELTTDEALLVFNLAWIIGNAHGYDMVTSSPARGGGRLDGTRTVERYDSVRVGKGVASQFLALGPLAGRRDVKVAETRQRGD